MTNNPRSAAMSKYLAQAKAELAARITADAAGVPHFDSVAAISDPELTPFMRAMRLAGCEPVMKHGNLAEASECPHCRRGQTRHRFTRNQQEVICCAYCDN